MTIKELRDWLKQYDENIEVCIYVPGDDAGIWEIKDHTQFELVSTHNEKEPNEKGLLINIY